MRTDRSLRGASIFRLAAPHAAVIVLAAPPVILLASVTPPAFFLPTLSLGFWFSQPSRSARPGRGPFPLNQTREWADRMR